MSRMISGGNRLASRIRQLLPLDRIDPAEATRAYTLLVANLVGLVIVTIFLLLTPILEREPALPYLHLSVVLVAILVSLFMLRRGSLRPAVATILTTVWVVELGTNIFFGGSTTTSDLAVLLVIFFMGLLWSPRAAVVFTVVTALAVAVREWARPKGWLPEPLLHTRPESEAVTIAAVILVAGVLIYLAVREHRRSREKLVDHGRQLELEMRRREAAEHSLRRSEKLDALGRLAGGISHDFNNLLTVILGNVDLVDLELRSRAEGERGKLAERVLQIRGAAERAQGMTRQILAFSREQVGHPETFDPAQRILELAPMLRRLTRESIRLDLTLGDSVGTVFIDPIHLDQIVLNLVINASEAISDSGRVTLAAESVVVTPGDGATNDGVRPGRFVRITVEDDGVGIGDEDRDKIFDPFYTTKSQGHGLGLASVYGIVRRAGGHVSLDTARGRGSRFRVHLPIAAPRPRSEMPAGVQSAFAASGRVLLCEDDPSVRLVLRRMLESGGYEVQSTRSAEQALARATADAERFDLLLTDFALTGMSGLELARELRARDPELPVVIASGYPDDDHPRDAIRDVGIHFLAKPLTREALLGQLDRVLGEVRSRN